MTRIRAIFFGLTAASLLLLPACTDLTFDNRESGITCASALTLSLTIDGMGIETATRAAVNAEPGETGVGTFTLFFFGPGPDRSGQLVDWIVLDNPSLVSPTAIPTDGKAISASDAYHVIGVANAGSYMGAGWEAGWTNKSEAEFRNGALAPLPASIESGKLLMNGSAVKTAGNGHIDMRLTRNVARFDVENKASAYSLVSAQLRNIFTASSVTGDATMDYAADNTGGRSGVSATIGSTGGELIKGALYAFENRATAPSQGDKVTTCLIVGLLHEGTTKYYRVNVHPQGEGQNIRRNKVYMVSIADVNGEGYADADAASNGTGEGELDYTINNWDLGDNGLIVSDSYSILALPVKTAQIGKEAITLAYTVTTFSTLGSPSPLTIKSAALDNGLAVSLDGNTLTVSATALQNGNDTREGSVTLAYAGLEATMNIVQSLKAEAFLKLSYEEGWSGLLGPNQGEETKTVHVNASGSWKAMLVGDAGFSFNPHVESNEMVVGDPHGDFKIYAVSPNVSKTAPRNAFVIVSLDADPLNCVAVVSVTQAVASEIGIDPMVETITLNGTKSSPDVNPVNNIARYRVASATGTITTLSVTEGDGRFGCSFEEGWLTIYTKLTNTSPANYTGRVSIADDRGGELILNLIQRPLALSVAVTQPTAAGSGGGGTGSFNLSIDDPFAEWKAGIVTHGVNGNIFNHAAWLEYTGGDKAGQPVLPGDILSASTPVRIVFPKIYFPNREIDIRATVTFTTTDGATASHTFTQNRLASRGVNIWNLRGGSYGSLNGSHFIDEYAKAVKAFADSFTNNTENNPPAAYPANTTYIHTGSQFPSSFTWTTVNSFRNSVEGVTVVTCDEYNTESVKIANNFFNPLDYMVFRGGSSEIKVAGSLTNSRVGQFLTTNGKTKLNSPATIPGFAGDGIRTYLDAANTGFQHGGVAVLVNPSSPGQVYLMIDPVKRIVFIGESQVFDQNANLSGNRKELMDNFVHYVVNAAKYGSHFTDMLRDDGAFVSIPPMWDANTWGDNAWPARSN